LTAEGFTLIELLIVVTIIAILAAIAVPNFLEAQTRSKVSRAKADMRTLATAIEAYAVDHTKYPLPGDEEGNPVAMADAEAPFFETRLSPSITTPIAYLTQRLLDPFPARISSENRQLHYGTVDYAAALEGDEGREEFYLYLRSMALRPMRNARYFILSHGPDLDHDGPEHHDHGHEEEEEEHEHGHSHPALYDPSNGTVSNGDVVYFGPGIGFGN